ncbi:MAG: M20/M25/M40 family metallo-hydrolase [Bilophila wadsworthia]
MRTRRGLYWAYGHRLPAGTAGARPFRLDRAADRATGPGVTDMKAGIVQNMFVARALKELGLMDVPMTPTFSPDEELGSFHNPHSGRAAQRRAGRHLYRTGLSRRRGDAGTKRFRPHVP